MEIFSDHKTLLDSGLFSTEFNRDPWPVYEELRRRDSMICSLPEATCVSVKHAEIRTALGTDSLTAEPPARFGESDMGTTFRDLDGAHHQRLRTAFMPLFRRQVIEKWAPSVMDPVIIEILDKVRANGGADFVSMVAEPLAIRVACRMMGIPESDGLHLYRLAHVLMQAEGNAQGSQLAQAASKEIRDYLLGQLRRPPVPDTLMACLKSSLRARALNQNELVSNLILVFSAATKPMAAGLSNTFFCLAHNPTESKAAGRNPAALRDLISESLRYETPLDLIPRYAKQDTKIGGKTIPEGTQLLLALASGNRDESVYSEPAALNPLREKRTNLAFGAGRHACMGRYMALELLERSVSAVLQRFNALRLGMDAPPMITGPFVRMPQRLEMEVCTETVTNSKQE